MSGSGTGTPAVGGTGVVTLQTVERDVARRCGPFLFTNAGGSSTSHVVVAELQSGLNLGDTWVGLYLLRRGFNADGTPVLGFNVADRQRLVKTYNPSNGFIEPDRGWAMAPVANERLEFHLLDPQHELRVATRAGIDRCYFDDRVTVALTTAAVERNLTAAVPWIVQTQQVLEVEFVTTNVALHLPAPTRWWFAFLKAGDVWLKTAPDPYPNQLLVTARRSHFTWINGVTNTAGPTADEDVLDMEPEWAASAGHIEAWRIARTRLFPVAQTGMTQTQETAAADFTRVSARNYQSEYVNNRNRLRLGDPVGLASRTKSGLVIVNL